MCVFITKGGRGECIGSKEIPVSRTRNVCGDAPHYNGNKDHVLEETGKEGSGEHPHGRGAAGKVACQVPAHAEQLHQYGKHNQRIRLNLEHES